MRTYMDHMAPRNRGHWSNCCLLITALLLLVGTVCPVLADTVSVSGNPGSLIINSAIAGSDLSPVTDATTTYGFVLDSAGQHKITGAINSAMPPNTSLTVTFEAPAGAGPWSAGPVILVVTPKDLVGGFTSGQNQSGLGITYEFSATIAAGIVSSASRTVTFTVIKE